jgi:beta-glucanase (GH16 family)
MQKNQRTKAVPCPDPFTYHTFGLDWQPNKIVFRLDGKDAYEVDRTSDSFDNWPFKDPFFIIVNLAIGGDWGGSKGVDPAIFPAKFDISYIRFYQKN